jgi:hypothetical protein
LQQTLFQIKAYSEIQLEVAAAADLQVIAARNTLASAHERRDCA